MLEPHVHCATCGNAIATKIKVAGGKTKDVEIKSGQQPLLLPGPNGIMAATRQVPLCDDCHEQLIAEQQAQAASRLLVPSLHVAR